MLQVQIRTCRFLYAHDAEPAHMTSRRATSGPSLLELPSLPGDSHARVLPWRAAGVLGLVAMTTAAGLAHAASSALGARSGPPPLGARYTHGRPLARAAREISVQETGHLYAVSPPGVSIEEKGHASGTFNCSITVHLTLSSATRAIASFTVRPRGGTLSGKASARFAQQGGNGYFGGSLTITRGTGSFAHAAAAGMGISGVIDRESYALTVHVNGKLRL
jgi:hypothetical protein